MNISVRELALQIATLARRVDALARTRPQLAYSSLEDGSIEEYDRDGTLVSRIGQQPDGSHGVVVIDGPDPLRTSPPTASAKALSIAVTWDGNFIDPDSGTVDAELPAYEDFQYVEVHVGNVGSFVPDKSTLSGFINSREGGTVGVPAPAGTRYVKLVTRSLAGKTSVPSAAASVEVPNLVDPGQFDDLQDSLGQAQTRLDGAQDMLDAAFPSGTYDVRSVIDAETAAAEAAATAAAAIDAATKANQAKDDAIAAAATDAAQKAADAQAAAEAAAATDAQNKANAAKAAAEAAAKAYADGEIDATALAVAQAAAADAQAKADAAKNAAIAAAAADAKAKADAAQAAAIAAANTAIQKATNLIDNPTRLRALGRWYTTSSAAQTLSVETVDIGGIPTQVLRMVSTGLPQAFSALSFADMFDIDSSKAYLISFDAFDEKVAEGTSGSQFYFGISVLNAAGSDTGVIPVFSSSGGAGVPSTNFYFTNYSKTQAPAFVGQWRRYVAYLMPHGTDPLKMKGLGVNIGSNAILPPDAAKGRVRILNYANTTAAPRYVDVLNPSVVEVDPQAVMTALSAEAAAATAQARAEAVKLEAIQAAATDAQSKADAAKSAAEAAAKQYADGAISASTATVLAQAASDAQDKADAAEAAALQAAAIDAQTKANAAADAAEAAAKAFATGEADAAELAAKQAAAADAQTKADTAKSEAIAAAAADATTKANNAKALAEDYANGKFNTAMAAANSKNTITYAGLARGSTIPTTPPSKSGRINGDIHRIRYTDNGEIASEWSMLGGAWVQVKFGDAILTSLDVGKLVAGTGTFDTAVINQMATQLASIIQADIGNLTVTGTAEMNTLVAQAIAAKTAEFLEITANQIVGGEITALIKILTQGELQVGDEAGVHVRIHHGRLEVLIPGEDGPMPIVSVGQDASGVYRVVDPDTGDVLAALQADGSLDATEVRTGSLVIGGDDLSTVMYPKGEYVGRTWTNPGTTYGPYTVDMPVLEVQFDVVAGSVYSIEGSGWTRGNAGQAFNMQASYTFSTSGTPAAPVGGSTLLTPYFPMSHFGTRWEARTGTWWFQADTTGRCRVLIWLQPDPGGAPISARDWWAVVRREGTVDRPGFSGVIRANPGSQSTTTPPPATDPLVKHVETFDLGPHAIWAPSFRVTSGYKLDAVPTGYSSSAGILYRTYLVLPSAARSVLSRADSVEKVEVFLSVTDYPSSPVKPHFGTATSTNITGSSAPSERNINAGTRAYSASAMSGWSTLTGNTPAALLAGDPTLLVRYSSSGQPLVRFHGPGAGSTHRPKIRITSYRRS